MKLLDAILQKGPLVGFKKNLRSAKGMIVIPENDEWRGGYKQFPEQEMACRCGCGLLPRHSFMLWLTGVRVEANFPFIISSGARCAFHNRRVSKSGRSGPHVLLLAGDIVVAGPRAYRLIEIAIKHGVMGIGIMQKGDWNTRFIHLDMIPRTEPLIWSY